MGILQLFDVPKPDVSKLVTLLDTQSSLFESFANYIIAVHSNYGISDATDKAVELGRAFGTISK